MRASSAAVRRAAVLVLVALAVAMTCTLLGRWQWNKHVTRDALIATVDANWAAPPVPLTSLVGAPGDEPTASGEWRSVSLTGHYLSGSAVLLRNRPVNGQPAYHVLVPFQADGGGVLVVDRGWVPVGNDAQRGTDVPVRASRALRARSARSRSCAGMRGLPGTFTSPPRQNGGAGARERASGRDDAEAPRRAPGRRRGIPTGAPCPAGSS